MCYKESFHYLSPRSAYNETKFISQEAFVTKSVYWAALEGEVNIGRDHHLCVKLTETKDVQD